MNGSDFQRLARVRLRAARLLLAGGCFDGAYYLGGYAVECALKACIAKKTQRHDFPDRDSNKYYTHGLETLARIVGPQLESDIKSSVAVQANWAIVTKWTHESRCAFTPEQSAASLLKAISSPRDGVMACIRKHW